MKKILCIASILCACLGSAAQDVMEQINAIKLKGGHLTAQYSHEVVDSAFSMGARDILHQLNLKGLGKFTLDEILPYTGHLDMPRGNMVRVFTYLDMAKIHKKDNANAPRETITIKPKFDLKDNTGSTTPPTPPVPAQVQAQYPQPPQPPVAQRVEANNPQAQLARDIMAQKDLTAVMNNLKAKKNAGIILDYGAFAKGTNIDEVYIAIFDRNTNAPMTILTPTTEGKRSNLISREEDSLSNYHGCKAIWISF